MSVTALASKLDPIDRRHLPPHCYLWSAVWWRVESQRACPRSTYSLQYSKNQLALYRDMIRRPEHYRRKPTNKTDWLWSELKSFNLGLDAL